MNERTPADTRQQPSTFHPATRRALIVLYVISAALFWISQYLYIPTLPIYIRSKIDNFASVGVVLAMYGLWQAIIRLPLGIAADWFGRRKPFIIICFALAGSGAWMMGTADGIAGLIVGRAFTGLAAGSWVLLIVAFSSLFPPEEAVRATAMLALVSSLARMLATGVTGFLNNLGGYPLAFFLAMGIAGLAILCIIPVGEQSRTSQRLTKRHIVKLITRRDVVLPSFLNAVLQYVMWGTTFGFLPIQAKEFGATDVIQSALVTMNIVVVTLGNLATTAIVRRIGARRLIYAGFVSLFLGAGVAALAANVRFVFVAQFFIGLGAGICYPVLMGMSIRYVDETERGTAMGLHQAVYAIGMFAGPWLSGILADRIGMKPMFGGTGLVCLIIGIMSARWLNGHGCPENS